MREINLEFGRPTLEEALRKLDKEIENCKRLKIKIIKIIHGYGSTGKGGIIRKSLREELPKRKDIKRIVYGEDFKILNKDAYELKQKENELNQLFYCNNKGITVIELN